MCLKDTLLRFVNVEWGMLNVELVSQGVLSDSFLQRDTILSRAHLSCQTNVPGYQASGQGSLARLWLNALSGIDRHPAIRPCGQGSLVRLWVNALSVFRPIQTYFQTYFQTY